MANMYILFITNGYPTDKYRGNGIFEFDQAKAVSRLGHKVVIAAIDLHSIRRWRKWGIQKTIKEEIEIYSINIPLGFANMFFYCKITAMALACLFHRILREKGKPEILHAHFTEIGYAASFMKNKYGIPLVITEHSSRINKDVIERNLFGIAAHAYQQADVLITVSTTLLNRIRRNFNINSKCIPNIVDTEIFEYSPKIDSGSFQVVTTGNLIHAKRIDLVIEAFYKAFANIPNTTLVIFGEGNERPNLESMIDSYNMNDRVILRGMQSRNAIAEALRQSDIFALASQSETFGVAYIEALSMGVPVIATRCGGPEDYVSEKNGILIPVDDLDALTDAMQSMYQSRGKFDNMKISEETKRAFSSMSIGSQLNDIYNSILKGKETKT